MHQGHLVRQTTAHSQLNPPNCRVEGKITLLSTLHTLTAVLPTVHTCTPHHLRHPAMHAQPANEQGFPLPSLGSCAAQQSATRLEQWTPHLKTVVCACSVGTTLSPPTHSYQSRPNYPISVISCIHSVHRRREEEESGTALCTFACSFPTGRQLASAYRGGGGGGALQQQVRAFTNYGG